MKPTLELQEIVSALGIDPFRFLAWQEKELARKTTKRIHRGA